VLLNVTPEHIDWHGSLENYAADKARIFANLDAGDVAVVDIDDPGSARFADSVRASGVRLLTVGLSREADARLEDDVLVVGHGGEAVRLVETGELHIRGTHNISNALAASAAALAAGADPEAVRAGLRSFMPIEHRLEPVGAVDGVAFVNDSKATNPDAVLKALTAFDGEPLIVLLGGRNKGNSFDELAAACGESCKLSVLYGEARPELEEAFASAGAPFELSTGLVPAMDLARRRATEGDTVLLSPACASFDEFTGYEQRGQVFTAAVHAWIEESR
jgi:UDP-N-acetylmuramoylalanine--D-glutamate ligase